MYDAFLYVVANDGVAKESAYPFLGKVSHRIHLKKKRWYLSILVIKHSNYAHSFCYCSNRTAITRKVLAVPLCQVVCPSTVAMKMTF